MSITFCTVLIVWYQHILYYYYFCMSNNVKNNLFWKSLFQTCIDNVNLVNVKWDVSDYFMLLLHIKVNLYYFHWRKSLKIHEMLIKLNRLFLDVQKSFYWLTFDFYFLSLKSFLLQGQSFQTVFDTKYGFEEIYNVIRKHKNKFCNNKYKNKTISIFSPLWWFYSRSSNISCVSVWVSTLLMLIISMLFPGLWAHIFCEGLAF